MPTKREREYYSLGFADGVAHSRTPTTPTGVRPMFASDTFSDIKSLPRAKPKRKLSAWNKFVKANSNKPRFRYSRSTSQYKKGQLNLKKMAVAFRKTPAGRKSRK
jgi:hypothetical protein